MKPVDTIDLPTIKEILSRQTDNFLLEAKLNPAIIYMKRGTVIPVHHFRKVTTPNELGFTGGKTFIIAGIDPQMIPVVYHYYNQFSYKLRDFYTRPIMVVPPIFAGMTAMGHPHGRTEGWDEPDESGMYCVKTRYSFYRKFRKILTIIPDNIERIESPIANG